MMVDDRKSMHVTSMAKRVTGHRVNGNNKVTENKKRLRSVFTIRKMYATIAKDVLNGCRFKTGNGSDGGV